jgi:hydrogenase maturation protease
MRRVLVAGVGNVFFGDDGFGVEVVRRLREEELPPGVDVVDFGVRSLHLAFELLGPPPLELFVLVDSMARGGEPGTLYVIDPDRDPHALVGPPDAHAIDPSAVLASLSGLGGSLPPTRIVGCEPASLDHAMRLSPQVREAVLPAVRLVRRLVEAEVSHGMEKKAPR